MTSRTASLADAIRLLDERVDEKRGGLPEDLFLFVSRITPLVNVDLLITDKRLGTLLTWRHDKFFGPGWHVPGGIIRFGEYAADRIRITADDELGAQVESESIPALFHESISPDRRERGHFISLLYRCRLVTGLDQARRNTSTNPLPGQWQWHRSCPADLIPQQSMYRQFIG